MSRKIKFKRSRRAAGPFVAVPCRILESQAYLELSPYGRMLLVDLLAQYKGFNNGDLTAAWTVMRPRGWRSEATLNKAKKQVLASGLVVETRKGRRPNKCSLYGLTFYTMDECQGKTDIRPGEFPFGRWAEKERLPLPPEPNRNDFQTTPKEVMNA